MGCGNGDFGSTGFEYEKFKFSEEQTKEIICLTKKLEISLERLVLICLVKSIFSLTGKKEIIIEMISNGRFNHPYPTDLPISHTVGELCLIYPVLISEPDSMLPVGQFLNHINQQIQDVPSVLSFTSFLRSGFYSKYNHPSIFFNFIGDLDIHPNIKLLKEDIGSVCPPVVPSDSIQFSLLNLQSFISEDSLHLEFGYYCHLFSSHFIKSLVDKTCFYLLPC